MIITAGIDIGSITSKCVILKDGEKVLVAEVYNAGTGTEGPERVVRIALEKAKLSMEDINYVVATGYGRIMYKPADEEVSEIACHGKGAYFQEPEARTVIDIGGQDAKAIRLAEGGQILHFEMNEKCAAGTGRFLDVMAQALGYPVTELASLGGKASEKVAISSTCTVFAESEVISHLTSNKKVEDIVAGIHDSIGRRIAGLARRVGLKDKVIITGGVAQNEGVVKALGVRLGVKLTVPKYPQLNGALGAAVFAYEKYKKRLKEEKNGRRKE